MKKHKSENENTYSMAGALVRGMPVDFFFFFSASKAVVDFLETPLSIFFLAAAPEVEVFRFRATEAG